MARAMRPLSVVDVSLLLIRVMVGAVFFAHGGRKLWGWWGGSGMGGLEVEGSFIQSISLMRLHVPFVAEPVAIPEPAVAAWLAAVMLFAGGLMLATGVIARVAAVLLAGTMAVAIMAEHHSGFFLPTGMEFALTLGVVCVALTLCGAGRLTLFGVLSGSAFRTPESAAAARSERERKKKLLEGDGLEEAVPALPVQGGRLVTKGPLATPPPAPLKPALKVGPSDAARGAPPPMRPDMRPRGGEDET